MRGCLADFLASEHSDFPRPTNICSRQLRDHLAIATITAAIATVVTIAVESVARQASLVDPFINHRKLYL